MKISRRRMLGTIATVASAAGVEAQSRPAAPAAARAKTPTTRPARATGTPAFFTAHELATIAVLADLIVPADARSGSASAAGVPAFIDFMMVDQPKRQVPMRGGLAWLDAESQRRFDRTFVDCTAPQRTAILDDIAWPARARPEMSQGVAFFTSLRDLVATGFFTSEMGIADLQYKGNTFVADYQGCPPEVLRRLGVGTE